MLVPHLLCCRYDFADWLSSRVNMQLSNEAGQSQVMGDIDIKGKDWNGQVKLGTPQFLGECSLVCLGTDPWYAVRHCLSQAMKWAEAWDVVRS
jgi:hypothetical protein